MNEVRKKTRNDFIPRMFSALFLIPLALLPLWFGGWLFAALLIVAGYFVSREWSRLIYGSDRSDGKVQAYGLAAGAALATLLMTSGNTLAAFLITCATAFALAAFDAWYRCVHRGGFAPPVWGVVYLIFPLMILVAFRQDPELGFQVIVWLMVVVWASDTGAYIAGRLVGGPRLVARLSPGKTWAGLGGGVIVAAFAGYLGGRFIVGEQEDLGGLLLLSVALAIISQVGDILESSLKRNAGVKDSGTLIPGHGGLLDRVDGLIFVILAAGAISFIRTSTLSPAGVLLWP